MSTSDLTPRALNIVEPEVLEGLSCSLPPEGADRRRVETARLFQRALRCEWLADGARLHFDASDEMAQSVLDFVLVERGCCSQVAYAIESVPPHAGIALVLRGETPRLRDAIQQWVGEER